MSEQVEDAAPETLRCALTVSLQIGSVEIDFEGRADLVEVANRWPEIAAGVARRIDAEIAKVKRKTPAAG